MQRRACRHLPVVDAHGVLVGVLSKSDLRPFAERLEEVRVESAMTAPAISARPSDSIEQAAELMLRRRFGSLPVVDDQGRLIGIITTTDLLAGLLRLLRGSEESTARIDFTFPSEEHGFPDLIEVVERAGGKVLALGTEARDRPGEAARFYVRVRAAELQSVVEAMRSAGYRLSGVP